MVTEEHEPAWELSDVVHDETMSSHGDVSSPIDIPIDPELLNLQPHTPTTLDHTTFSDTDASSPSVYNLAAHLEREMASYLQEDALDEPPSGDTSDSARPFEDDTAERDPRSAIERQGTSSGESTEENILSIGGLAAFLQAAHAQAEDKENRGDGYHYEVSHEGLTRRHQAQDSVKMTTRAVPAFHSLNVDSADSGPSTLTTAIYDKYSELNMSDNPYGHNAHEPSTHSGNINSDNPPDVPGFGDINELLHDLSDFEHRPDDHEDSPTPPSRPPQAPPRLPMYYASSDEDENVDQLLPSSPIVEPKKLAGASASSAKGSSAKEGGPKEHICEACLKTFTRKSDVSRHMRIHTGERPWVCSEPDCGRTFIQRSALLVHQRTHSGEKPHVCEYPGCEKTFSDSSSLARHRRTHTGKRPYQCEDPACDKTFTRRTSLTAHMKTHDPTWEPDPDKKYSFKAKRRKLGPVGSGLGLAGPMQAVSALFPPQPDNFEGASSSSAALSAPTITTTDSEIAAVWAQAQIQANEEDEDEDEDESGSDSGPGEGFAPPTSGIRGERGPPMIGKTRPAARTSPVPLLPLVEEGPEDEEFPILLRTRKGKEPVGVTGVKRKR